jgi:nitrite reductase/ring-hydroxylating ferredoxin subunit
MAITEALTRAAGTAEIDRVAEPLSREVRGAYEGASPAGRQVKNALHGVWLRHPLHPVFTDIPIGAWTAALAMDAAGDGDPGMERATRFAIGVGLAGAAGAAITGLTDWSETDGEARRTGIVHGLLNIAATTLFATSFVLRGRRATSAARTAAWTGYAVAVGSAWLGGDLVYRQRIGVTHAVADSAPDDFVAIADSASLADDAMIRARSGDLDVLLVRQRGRVRALVHSCSHLAGPLSEGTLKDGSVVCPWHGSEFSLEDGAVLNGPATADQPCLEVRERDGRIEVRRRHR